LISRLAGRKSPLSLVLGRRRQAHDDQLTEPGSERRQEPREGLEILQSEASFDEPVEDTLVDQLRVFSPPRRVSRHVDPDLQHIAMLLEVWASEHREALEIDHAGGHIRRVALGERHHLLSRTSGDARRCHDGKGHRPLARGVGRLERRLREERHEPVAPTLRG
jgi:hypothetical protein